MDTQLQLDDNLKNGTTYTFTFQLTNWLLKPDDATLLNDINQYAPDFMTSVGVVDVADISFSLSRGYRNIIFTYEGDGSDVVSDVANSILGAFKAGSNDNFQFTQAVAGSTGITTSQQVQQVTQPISDAAKVAGTAVSDVATNAAKAATDAINQALKGLLPLLAVVVLLILFVLPTLLKSAPGVSIGGGAR